MASHPRILIFCGLLWSTVSMLKLAFDVLPCILGATDQTCLSNQEVCGGIFFDIKGSL
jgi:hypothetical protein